MHEPYVIHLSDILSPRGRYDNCYVRLEDTTKRRLLDAAVNVSPEKTKRSLSRTLDIKKEFLYDFDRYAISLSLLVKLSEFLAGRGFTEFNMASLEKRVLYIKGRGNGNKISCPKFPINLSSIEGLRIISKMYHDGGLRISGEPHYNNQNISLIEEFCEDSLKVFGDVSFNLRYETSTSVVKVTLPRIIGDMLSLTGLKSGNKVLSNPQPPEWIKHTGRTCVAGFVRSAMDDEATIGRTYIRLKLASDITRQIPEEKLDEIIRMENLQRTVFLREFTKCDKPFVSRILLFDKYLMEQLGLNVGTVRMDRAYLDKRKRNVRIMWSVTLCSRANFLKFYKEIGFKSRHKQKKLEAIIEKARVV